MNYSSKRLIKLLENRGWVLDRIRGSHHVFKHKEGGFIVVPVHGNNDISKGVFYSILKDAGIDKFEV